MNTKHKKGSALVLVLVASLFLIILTAGAYRYFQTNVDTQIWTRDRIQAKLSAEAGVNLATYMLIAGASLPTVLTPAPILGTEGSHYDLPGGMGSVYATVDPNNSNGEITSANAFMIRCIAFVPGQTMETFGMESIIMPENLARFSVFMDNPATDGYYGDGYRFDGPFYANGPINIFSSSTTHENDVFFYSFKLTSDHYIYGQSSGGAIATTPSQGNLEMRPFHRLSLGAPYFELNVDPIPFGSDELDWQGVRSAAYSDGLYLDGSAGGAVPSGSRLVLRGDSLLVKQTAASAVQKYYLGGLVNPVVWIENNAGDEVYLRGDQDPLLGLDMALTIASKGSFMISGRLAYKNTDPQDPDNENLLGVMSVNGDIIIADAPNVLPDPAWAGQGECFQITTDASFSCYAVLVALDGQLRAEDHKEPSGNNEFLIVGGYMIQDEGLTGTVDWSGKPIGGFSIGVYFDPRLLFMHPPFFPTTANWNTTMWAERPDIKVSDVTNGLPAY